MLHQTQYLHRHDDQRGRHDIAQSSLTCVTKPNLQHHPEDADRGPLIVIAKRIERVPEAGKTDDRKRDEAVIKQGNVRSETWSLKTMSNSQGKITDHGPESEEHDIVADQCACHTRAEKDGSERKHIETHRHQYLIS